MNKILKGDLFGVYCSLCIVWDEYARWNRNTIPKKGEK